MVLLSRNFYFFLVLRKQKVEETKFIPQEISLLHRLNISRNFFLFDINTNLWSFPINYYFCVLYCFVSIFFLSSCGVCACANNKIGGHFLKTYCLKEDRLRYPHPIWTHVSKFSVLPYISIFHFVYITISRLFYCKIYLSNVRLYL